MAVDEDSVSKIFSVLSHPIRRRILQNLNEKGECSFTDMMNTLGIDTGKLSFHIRNLNSFIEQTSSGKYRLNNAGQNALRLVKELQSWAGEANIYRKATELRLASFKKRTYAYLMDFILMLAVVLVPTLLNALTLFTGDSVYSGFNMMFFIALVLLWGYSTLLEGFRGQTLGKRVMGLQVVRIDGKNLFYDYAAVRNFGKAFLLPFDVFIGLRLNDKRFIRYFDKFSGTTVIDLKT
jgi:uncharacterized RDD family membrane protein YckC